MAAWAPMIPFAKLRTGVDDGALGLLLLCLGIGSLVTMPAAGVLAARFGCRAVIVVSTLVICVSLGALATVTSPALLAVALLVFGASLGALDVVINLHAVIVERASGRTMMSGFHGLFSIGGVCGAAGVSALLAAGAAPGMAVGCVMTGLLIAIAAASPHLLPYADDGSDGRSPAQDGRSVAWPRGIVLIIGLLCCAVFLMEGAVLDWSAVFLTSVRDLPAAHGGLGYAAFAATMTVGRLTGDRVVQRLGGQRVVRLGGLLAAAGVALTVLVPAWPATLLGYALVGAGCSNIVPVLYSSAGRQTIMPQSQAIPAITTLGYGGILLGPAAIGGIAHVASLPVAFTMLSLMMIAVAASARRIHQT